MAIIKTEAVVLKSFNYRDKSRIVSFYTRSHGKLSCVARGVRDTKSKFSGSLQSMSFVEIIFYYKENRTLHNLSSAEFVRSFQNIYSNEEKLSAAFRITDLLNRTTTENHPSENIFNCFVESLALLDDADKNFVNIFYKFVLQLSKQLGVEINANNSLYSDRVGESNNNYFLTSQDAQIINRLDSWNLKQVTGLFIDNNSANRIEKFFENYFRHHLDHVPSSKVDAVLQKVNSA